MNHGFEKTLITAWLLVPLVGVACGDSQGGPGGGGGGTANEQACARLKNGSFMAVSAPATYTDQAPKVKADDRAYRLALQTTPTLQRGHVGFDARAAGDYVIFTSKTVPVVVFTYDGTLIPPTSSVSAISECGEVKGRDAFRLDKVETYVLRLGPEASGTVDVVIEPGP